MVFDSLTDGVPVAEQQGFRCDASTLKLHSFGLEVKMLSDY